MFIENTLYTKSQIQNTSTNTIHSCANGGEFLGCNATTTNKEECVKRNYVLQCLVCTSKRSQNISQYDNDYYDDSDNDNNNNNNNNNNNVINNLRF